MIVPYLTDWSPADALIRRSIGLSPIGFDEDKSKERHAILRFLQFAPGTVVDAEISLPSDIAYLSVDINVYPGMSIYPPQSSDSRYGSFIAVADSYEQLKEAEARTLSCIKVSIDPFL